MRTARMLLVVLGAVLVLGVAHWDILGKQAIVAHGREILLPLRPVDPRSLIQGDYMRLRYRASVHPDKAAAALPRRGTVVLALDGDGVGAYARPDDGTALAPGEARLRYMARHRDGTLRYGGESFFFQEGDAALYRDAKYGRLRVDDAGRAVLVGVAGEDRRPLGHAR
ncbi:MAG: GDYXXLXY domain-containing protein [Hyphomicrobiales bacterium]|nr:GDYXXLXY domain-containing protein [Hyphomicrobiales bacterium]MCP5372471.1 GDYXXLXY domain-containing protein [Hyphomicrobiales bacterium]